MAVNERDRTIGKLIRKVEKHYKSDVYLYSGPVNYVNFGKLLDEVVKTKANSNGKRKVALLIITTRGGDPMSAYMIANLLHQVYDEFIIFPPNFCQSAGTLIALGAHKILMDIISQFSPLDVQTIDKNNLAFPKSGLQYEDAIKGMGEASTSFFLNMRDEIINESERNGTPISVTDASMDAAYITAELFKTIANKLDPHEIGNDYRNLQIAEKYGKRLASVSKNLHRGTLQKLIYGYPAHDIAITKNQASKMFRNVDFPCEEMRILIAVIGKLKSHRYWINANTPNAHIYSLTLKYGKLK